MSSTILMLLFMAPAFGYFEHGKMENKMYPQVKTDMKNLGIEPGKDMPIRCPSGFASTVPQWIRAKIKDKAPDFAPSPYRNAEGKILEFGVELVCYAESETSKIQQISITSFLVPIVSNVAIFYRDDFGCTEQSLAKKTGTPASKHPNSDIHTLAYLQNDGFGVAADCILTEWNAGWFRLKNIVRLNVDGNLMAPNEFNLRTQVFDLARLNRRTPLSNEQFHKSELKASYSSRDHLSAEFMSSLEQTAA